MPKVFVSDAILEERLAFGAARSDQGRAHASWKALSALYQASLIACGYRIVPVIRPEIYQTEVARSALGVEPGDWHLAVKPIEHLRPFHGIPNVFVCDWPYPELSAEARGSSPFFDQARLLKMADAILCCTDFTTEVLRRAGLERAMTVPPCLPPLLAEGTVLPRPGPHRRFLAVIDAGHLSRQLGPTIAGFAAAARQREGLSLVICVLGADAPLLADLRRRVAGEETISILGGGAEGAAELYAGADVFLCADAAPGLCLPLVQALQAGLPVIAPLTGGIGRYLPPEAAVPLATGPGTLEAGDEPIAGLLSLTTNPASAETLCDAVLTAATLEEEARLRMASIGRAIAAREFGLAAFKSGMARRGTLLSLDAP